MFLLQADLLTAKAADHRGAAALGRGAQRARHLHPDSQVQREREECCVYEREIERDIELNMCVYLCGRVPLLGCHAQ